MARRTRSSTMARSRKISLRRLAFFAGDDFVGDGAHHVVGLLALDVGVGHPGDFGEYRPPDLDDGGINASEAHSKTLLCFAENRVGQCGRRPGFFRRAVQKTPLHGAVHTNPFYHILPGLKRAEGKKASKK